MTHRTAGAGGAGMAGNVILGGLIGAAVDANSGATQDLVPNPLTVHLTPVAPVATPAAATVADKAPVQEAAPEAPAETAPAAPAETPTQ